MTKPTLKGFVTLGLIAGSAMPVFAQDSIAGFYKGKSITLMVGTTAGGGYDTYARLIQRHMSKHMPGNPNFLVTNMPGAGSNVAANYVYNVGAKDGTVIGALFGGAPLEPLIGPTPVQHDPSKSQYIGSANNDVYVCVARKDANVTSFDEVFQKELLVGAGNASSTSDFPSVLNAVLSTKFKLVLGYPGSREIALAADKKEVWGACGFAWPSISVTNSGWFGTPDSSMRVLVQTHVRGNADLNKQGVPNAMSYAKTDEQRAMLELFFSQQVFGRPYVVSPEVPKERVDALRKAFLETLRDPELLADARKANLEVDPVSGEEVAQLVARVYAAPKDMVAKIKKALTAN